MLRRSILLIFLTLPIFSVAQGSALLNAGTQKPETIIYDRVWDYNWNNEDEDQPPTKTAEQLARERARKAECIQEFGTYYGTLVANEQVVLGMTRYMVKKAWGLGSWYRGTTRSGASIWQYTYHWYNLWFVDDKLIQVQFRDQSMDED